MRELKLFDISKQEVYDKTSYTASIAEQDTQNTYNPIARQREAEEKSLQVYATYQNATIRAGEPAYTLLLKAIKAISLMTGNKLFYSQIYKDLKAIYGEGLKEQIPLEWELDEVRERLANMREAIERETTDPDSKDRIKKAIEAHEKRELELLELLEKETRVK